MSIFERPSRLFNRVAREQQDRRSFLRGLSASLGVPLAGQAAAATPPGKTRVLDPADPVAVELARLYDVLRAAHVADIRLKRRMKPVEDRLFRGPAMDGHELKSYEARHDAIFDDCSDATTASVDAYHDLLDAVISAHGGGNATLEEWYRYGTAHRVVMVGNRIYSACPDIHSDFTEETVSDEGDGACVVLSVIDLDL